jgi:tRNA threonylcarbamoyladenosine biosynthesis protein TsaE
MAPSAFQLKRMRSVITHNPEETIDWGRRLAQESLAPPKLVLLRGPLGAGKTTLAKGIAEGFGAAPAEEVTSPTFTLIHEYRGPGVHFYHIDLYRIDTERELATLGLEDLFEPANVLLIEWGEKFPRLLRSRDLEIVLEVLGETDRKISVIE